MTKTVTYHQRNGYVLAVPNHATYHIHALSKRPVCSLPDVGKETGVEDERVEAGGVELFDETLRKSVSQELENLVTNNSASSSETYKKFPSTCLNHPILITHILSLHEPLQIRTPFRI